MEALGLIAVGFLLWSIGRSVYWLFDHGRWKEGGAPDLNATIEDISTKR